MRLGSGAHPHRGSAPRRASIPRSCHGSFHRQVEFQSRPAVGTLVTIRGLTSIPIGFHNWLYQAVKHRDSETDTCGLGAEKPNRNVPLELRC